uniref:Uncharacterized protein n=1 Tax=Pyxicephalus adspersus TaxID=30357 RepID=A0AAV3A012_PYXAD|nr:TPA: hypothetical protein GDO54_017149 [Pyxicephalus adspersus]
MSGVVFEVGFVFKAAYKTFFYVQFRTFSSTSLQNHYRFFSHLPNKIPRKRIACVLCSITFPEFIFILHPAVNSHSHLGYQCKAILLLLDSQRIPSNPLYVIA